MTNRANRTPAAKHGVNGFTLVELMTVVAVVGFLGAIAMPSIARILQRQEPKNSTTDVAGLLSSARSHAVSEGTPHLVYFNAPAVGADGNCGVVELEVRDADHSSSTTDGDDSRESRLPPSSCHKVKPYEGDAAGAAVIPLPREDFAVRAPDASLVGAVTPTPTVAAAPAGGGLGGLVGGLLGGLGGLLGGLLGVPPPPPPPPASTSTPVASAPAANQPRTSTRSETAVNGATFPIDAVSGRPVIAFSERGIPVDPADPNAWGSGAGGIYLTDGTSTFVALVAQLGDVKMRAFDPGSQSWK